MQAVRTEQSQEGEKEKVEICTGETEAKLHGTARERWRGAGWERESMEGTEEKQGRRGGGSEPIRG